MTSLGKQRLDVPRAGMQFQISLPMRFRIRGEKVWHEAWADSMSVSEIVFRGDKVIEIGRILDVRLVLPQPGTGRRGGTIVSKAKVMQSWPGSENPDQAFTVAALAGPRLLRFSPETRSDESESLGLQRSAKDATGKRSSGSRGDRRLTAGLVDALL
jgi:hypothetical protein